MGSKSIQREWFPPEGVGQQGGGGLMLYNSLVDEKTPFVPVAGPGSKQITWYTCGPTVYDSAHMGHARNYVTFDILRRVLEDYFGYNCLFVMNVTDVDDKIILRARRNYLLKQYCGSGKSVEQVREFARTSIAAAADKQSKKVDEAQALCTAAAAEGEATCARLKREELATNLKNESHKLGRINESAAALAALPAGAPLAAVLEAGGDFVAESLDKEQGAEVTDASIFRAHAAKFEREFMEDMDALGCRPPSVLTRVSEYIPEIIAYVERIIANGCAYESNGSVYFDTQRFRACGHTYGKLKPWAVGSAALAAEGEANFETTEKRCPQDFALWKAAKPGEPVWESPWGKGRPGWHIECSAMASSVFGQVMDIHSGGEDLRFPHHDNELAQAEAHYHDAGCRQWVNYFLHSGHLEIEGLKMSKSLKNFITIREALKTFSARQLRLMFALQPWNKPVMYGEQARGEMKAREASLKNFFQNVEVAVRGAGDQTTLSQRWEAPEMELQSKLSAAQGAVHAALCDNINTAGALDALGDLIKAVNVYLAGRQDVGAAAQPLLLGRCASYVTRILSVMGLVEVPSDRPGFTDAAGGASSPGDGGRTAAVLDALAAFRDTVRALAKSKAEAGQVLGACDALRDTTLVELGVRLEDRPDGKAVWKLDDPAALRAEIAERAAAAAEAARKKVEGALQRKQQERDKFAGLAALPPIPVALADKYSKFDAESGEPTHDKEGAELDGKARDKARKEFEKMRKVREPLAKKLAEDPKFMDVMAVEIEALRLQLEALAGPSANGNGTA